MNFEYDVVVIGAGAAGMFCAAQCGMRGRKILVLEHSNKPGEKIRISGGGRCNFTNLHTRHENFLSANPHFAKSALAQFTPQDFIDLVNAHGIAWHEKKLGQLFCDGKSSQIIDMLTALMQANNVELKTRTEVVNIEKSGEKFVVETSQERVTCTSLVIATGGKSIPKMGASDFGYQVATKFKIGLQETRPALVPFTFDQTTLETFNGLSGVSFEGEVSNKKGKFEEAILFTHRGLSGPAILQISSYWREGQSVFVTFKQASDIVDAIGKARKTGGNKSTQTIVSEMLPKSLAQFVCEQSGALGRVADLNSGQLECISQMLNKWEIKPSGSEGYRTAEVTLGGVDTNELSSRTMECKKVPGLFFIGEVVDVTGWLGGYNFQWAWSSAYAAGQVA